MRIITGSARGCKLKTPKGMETRPTADRIKESLFNILQGKIAGKRILDIFAGTGNLGLEALSRGAAEAVFVDKATAALISENAEHTHLAAKSKIMRADALAALLKMAAQKQQFDLIFCDPPYRRGLWEKVLQFIDENDILAPGGLVIVEHGRDENQLPSLQRLSRYRNETYGSTTQISFFAVHEA